MRGIAKIKNGFCFIDMLKGIYCSCFGNNKRKGNYRKYQLMEFKNDEESKVGICERFIYQYMTLKYIKIDEIFISNTME